MLVDGERSDWLQRAAAWDSSAAAAREEWCHRADTSEPPAGAAGAAGGSLAEVAEAVYLVEYSRAARSACRRCLRRIGEGEVRLGVQSHVAMFGQSVVAWHHARCLRLQASAVYPIQLQGLAALEPRDQARARRAIAKAAPAGDE